MKTFLVVMTTDDGNLNDAVELKAETAEKAEEAASLEYPNYDNYEAHEFTEGVAF